MTGLEKPPGVTRLGGTTPKGHQVDSGIFKKVKIKFSGDEDDNIVKGYD